MSRRTHSLRHPVGQTPVGRAKLMANREVSRLQFSLSSILAAVTTFGSGIALMRVTPALSLFNLVGLFIVGASFGIPFGYAKGKWRAAILFAFLAGAFLIGSLILLLCSGVLPEADPPPPSRR